MKKILKYVSSLLLGAAAVAGCMENDMSMPLDRAYFTVFNVEGQVSSTISNSSRTVTIVLDEYTDISAVVVDSIAMTSGATCADLPSPGDVIDMTSDLSYVLTAYYDYDWVVSASQTIERYVTCDNQVGEAFFNLTDKAVTLYVSSAQDVNALTIEDMKLEPSGSVILSTTGYEYVDGNWEIQTVECNFPDESITVNCLLQRTFEVSYKGEIITWTMSVVQQDVDIEVTSTDPWCYHVDVTGTYDGTGEPYFAYRKYGTSNWTTFDDVTVSGLNISATIPSKNTISESAARLSSGTTYEVKLCAGSSESNVVKFTTETPDQVDNMDFEDWCTVSSIVYPVAADEYEDKVWDTPNKGVASFTKNNIVSPDTFTATSTSTYAAKLDNTYAVVKFAAASLFVGEFAGLDGLGAVLNWGIPFTSRPRAIRGYYAYSPGLIDYVDNSKVSDPEDLDKGQIVAIVADWDSQFYVNSSKEIFLDYDSDEGIVGIARMESDVDTNGEYVEFELEFEYRKEITKPTYVVIVVSASSQGDLFTGSTDSLMYVDEFEFVYD